jgi:hypothetical protein
MLKGKHYVYFMLAIYEEVKFEIGRTVNEVMYYNLLRNIYK